MTAGKDRHPIGRYELSRMNLAPDVGLIPTRPTKACTQDALQLSIMQSFP
ncbi:MAG: hypothetical protein IKH57_22540 [Clostridia bacterium]|nr:hypothetical protein [Clostridia bacterium]